MGGDDIPGGARLYQSGFSGELEPVGRVCACVCVCVRANRFIVRNWHTQLWRLASPKSGGQAGRLETQGRADVTAQGQRQSGVEFSLPRGRPQSVSSSGLPTDGLHETYPHYRGPSALLQVH